MTLDFNWQTISLAIALILMHQLSSPEVAVASESNSFQLKCQDGMLVKGLVDQWTPRSKCPESYLVTGISRIDILGDHKTPTNHVNDLQCNDLGCRAWCIGNPCQLRARCCRVVPNISKSKKR